MFTSFYEDGVIWPNGIKEPKRDHWGFDDPAKAQGTDEEKWATFQRVRDEIGERIKHFSETGE